MLRLVPTLDPTIVTRQIIVVILHQTSPGVYITKRRCLASEVSNDIYYSTGAFTGTGNALFPIRKVRACIMRTSSRILGWYRFSNLTLRKPAGAGESRDGKVLILDKLY